MGDLSATYLQHLIQCINQQCSKTKEHTDQYRACFSNNRNSAGVSETLKELVFTMSVKDASGAYFNSIDGKNYLDISMGFGVHLFGHNPAFLQEAIQHQLTRGLAIGPLYENAAEVAQLICEMTGVERCAFYNSGTEAVMVAMRLARAATGKNKIVIFEGAYHGTFDSLLALKADEKSKAAISTVPGIPQSLTDDTLLLEFGKKESLQFIQQHANEIAAVLTEPVQSRHLENINPQFLIELNKITAAENIVLILDEIITGFRISNGGAAAHFNIKPDITTFGKIAGGGMPIGIVAGKRWIMDYIDGGSWIFGDDSLPSSATTFVAGTFCHHPLAMATAKATLLYLKEKNGAVQEVLNRQTTAFCEELNAWFREGGYPLSLLNFGSLFRFQLKGRGKLLYYALLKEGVYIWEGRNCFLSEAHDDNTVGFLSRKIKKCVLEMVASGHMKRSRITRAQNCSHAVQGAVKLEGVLDEDHFKLAANYLIEATPALNQAESAVEVVDLSAGEDINTWIARHDFTKAFHVALLKKEDHSILFVRGSKFVCDGWSLILFVRQLAKCYSALQHHLPMPEVTLLPHEAFVQWVTSPDMRQNIPERKFDLTEAASMHHEITMENKHGKMQGNLFTQLLHSFQKSVQYLEQDIAVPVAGQLISRQPGIFGACSVHVPVSSLNKNGSDTADDHDLRNPEVFRAAFLSAKKASPIVFNYDDLDWQLDFAGTRAALFNIDEHTTAHQLVCNVSRLSNKLVVSLKYAKPNYTRKQAEELLHSIVHHIEEDLCL